MALLFFQWGIRSTRWKCEYHKTETTIWRDSSQMLYADAGCLLTYNRSFMNPGIVIRVMSYILMRKAVACELGGSAVEVGCAVDLKRALRIVWGSTSGVGWEEARWPAGRDEEGRPSFFVPLLVPGVSLSLLLKIKQQSKPIVSQLFTKVICEWKSP